MRKLLSFLFIYSEIINEKCVWLRCVVSMKCENAEAQQIWYTHRPFQFTLIYNYCCIWHIQHTHTQTQYSDRATPGSIIIINIYSHCWCMAVKWNREIAIIWNVMLLSHTNWQSISWYVMRMMAVNFPKYKLQIEWMWRCDRRRTKGSEHKMENHLILHINWMNWIELKWLTGWVVG